MDRISIVLLILFISPLPTLGQETVNTSVKYGFENQEIQEVFDFQNISVEKFEFNSSNLIRKHYQVFIKEFKNGELVDSKILFNGTEMEDFRINSSQLQFKIFTQISNNSLKVQLRNKRYASAKKNLDLVENSSNYVAKDFFGSKTNIENPLDEEFPLLAIITPTKHSNGISSYCEVVQSDVEPEQLGKHFNIPHYFLITMKFK